MISICLRTGCNAKLKITLDGKFPLHYLVDSDSNSKNDVPCTGSYQMCYDPKHVTLEVCPGCKMNVSVSKSGRNIGEHFYPNGDECHFSFHHYDNEVGPDGPACYTPRKLESGNFPPI